MEHAQPHGPDALAEVVVVGANFLGHRARLTLPADPFHGLVGQPLPGRLTATPPAASQPTPLRRLDVLPYGRPPEAQGPAIALTPSPASHCTRISLTSAIPILRRAMPTPFPSGSALAHLWRALLGWQIKMISDLANYRDQRHEDSF